MRQRHEHDFGEAPSENGRAVLVWNALCVAESCASVVIIPAGTVTKWAPGGGVEEFFVVQRGGVVLGTDGARVSLAAGDYLVIPRGVRYQFFNGGQEDRLLTWFVPSPSAVPY